MRNFIVLICCLLFGVAHATEYGAVVISELMVDPEPCVGLPAVEYVELFNRSRSALSLSGWSLMYGEKSYPLPACSMGGGTYLLLCAKASVGSFPTDLPVAGMAAFPTLVNGGKPMGLVSAENEPVCVLEYSDSWYRSGFKANGGWSLECIDLSNFSGSGGNWTASTDAKGGTPGRRNSVSAENKASEVPVCLTTYVPDPFTVELHFSSFLKPESLRNLLHYEVQPANTLLLAADCTLPDTRVVALHLSDSLVSGETYRLRLTDLCAFTGWTLADTVLELGLPEPPDPGVLQINELMFNPKPGGCDYVEFVNTGTRCVDLSKIWLTNRAEDGRLNAGRRLSEKPLPCLPGSYWLLSESPDSVCTAGPFPRMPHALAVQRFPSMPDNEGSIVLITSSAEIVDELHYSDQMHLALISDPEGVALEKTRPEAPSASASSWVSASASAHFGTPGYRNSQFLSPSYQGKKGFYATQAWMTPNNDGRDDRLAIYYELPDACAGSLRLFDLQGRLVRTLANNEPLGLKGCYEWDGTRDDGSPAPSGRYLLFAEAFTPKGRVIRSRLVLTILF